MTTVTRFLNYVMALLFLTAAVLQYNDPDSLLWIFVYSLAAVMCVFWIRNDLKKPVPLVFAGICLVWSAFVIPEFSGRELFGSFGMQSIEIEEMREVLGLLIIAVWMLILALVPQKKPKEPAITGS